MKIDPTRTWRKVEERLKRETHPKRRRNLESVLAHMKAEAASDLDGLMATLAPNPSYHAFGAPPEMCPQGTEAVRAFYSALVASGCQRLELDVDRLVVDDDVVVTEGVMRIAYPGNVLKLMGHFVDDTDAFYLFETRMCVMWPMDEQGRILGEDTYTGDDGFEGILQRKLDPADLPALPAAGISTTR